MGLKKYFILYLIDNQIFLKKIPFFNRLKSRNG